ncbi:AP complex, mu/sigma subunit [Pholiota molesta]|nr:AP complex, mu/sigma subunit [Pholiota molesta]
MINYFLLISRQGKLRLAKWFISHSAKAKAKIVQDVTQLALNRRPRMCNFIEYKGRKIVYRRYASLFFICEINEDDNELITLEQIHRYVEALDKYFGNVCEMDLIFNFQKAYAILDELFAAGEMLETSKETVFTMARANDAWEKMDAIRAALNETSII